MAVTVVVRSGGEGEPSLTLDAPRIVIGRGEGCEVRLPDASVSHRHASIRQRGGEYVVVDENSANGTFLDRVRLPPQTPRAVRSGELVRVGRVWLEIRIEPAIVKGSTAAAAKELALGLVARGLAAQGEEPGPRVTVLAGPDQGKMLIVAESGRHYVIGRSKDVDFALDDVAAARRHVGVGRKGDALSVQDLGSPSGAYLDEMQIASGTGETVWRAGQVLRIGGSELGFDYPAAEALAEIERSPDERMASTEAPAPPSAGAEPEDAPAPKEPTPTPAGAIDAAPARKLAAKPEAGGWGAVDAVVVMLAIGVLAISLAGAFWLLGR